MFAALSLVLLVEAVPIVGRASVIDGDTLEIRGQRVRLWGVDAPEARQTCQRGTAEYPCGVEAVEALDRWIDRRVVTCIPHGRQNSYGPVVAQCSIQVALTWGDGGDNAVDLGMFMVSHGWAFDYPEHSRGRYALDQGIAQDDQAGLWAGTFEMPWEWRRRNP